MKSNQFLKVTGILMIIGGGISVILGLIAVIGVAALAALLGGEANSGLLTLSAILTLLSGVVSLIAGILGVKNAAVLAKAQLLIIFGIVTAGLSVLGNILNVVGGSSFSPVNLAIGLVLPALYLIGAFQNKKLADSSMSA